jgi:hypothetical protein
LYLPAVIECGAELLRVSRVLEAFVAGSIVEEENSFLIPFV